MVHSSGNVGEKLVVPILLSSVSEICKIEDPAKVARRRRGAVSGKLSAKAETIPREVCVLKDGEE